MVGNALVGTVPYFLWVKALVRVVAYFLSSRLASSISHPNQIDDFEELCDNRNPTKNDVPLVPEQRYSE